jgi:cytochrome b
VWDPLVRVSHWALVASVALAWLTQHGARTWHEAAGYAALFIIVVRLLWGWIGTRHARFSHFVKAPGATLRYVRELAAGREPRHLGHNPLGGWMIVALIVAVAAVGLSGWLYTTDAYWGVDWVGDLHEALSDVLIGLAALHVGGVIFTSWRQRENLVAAMVHGRKRPAGERDVA